MQAPRALAAARAHDRASGQRSGDFYPGGGFVAALRAAQRALSTLSIE